VVTVQHLTFINHQTTPSAILILKRYPCESGFPAAKNRGKMPLTWYLEMNLAP